MADHYLSTESIAGAHQHSFTAPVLGTVTSQQLHAANAIDPRMSRLDAVEMNMHVLKAQMLVIEDRLDRLAMNMDELLAELVKATKTPKTPPDPTTTAPATTAPTADPLGEQLMRAIRQSSR